jgi:hypothetical protein
MTADHAGDFARRVAHRREQLGLSREEIARRSGMDSGYLEYLERSAYVDLTGGTVELPPGAGGAGAHPSSKSTSPCSKPRPERAGSISATHSSHSRDGRAAYSRAPRAARRSSSKWK